MKKRKAFVSIMALIIMAVVHLMVLYLVYTTNMEYLILSSTINKNQSYYEAEGKLYMSIYDDKYYLNQLYPSIIEEFRKEGTKVSDNKLIIDSCDIDPKDNMEKINLVFFNDKERLKLKLLSESDLNNTKTQITLILSLVNEIFELDKSVLTLDLIEDKYKKDFEELFKLICEDININNCNIPNNMFGMESLNYSQITLEKVGRKNYEVYSLRENMENPNIQGFDKEKIFIVAKSFNENPVNLYIGPLLKKDNSQGRIRLSGVIFVEGDLIISEDFTFKGIIIIKNGNIIVDSTKNSIIDGLIIMDNVNNLQEFVRKTGIMYSRYDIYKYGTYIPGFLDVKIDLMKGN